MNECVEINDVIVRSSLQAGAHGTLSHRRPRVEPWPVIALCALQSNK
jgi:hypothetical protein